MAFKCPKCEEEFYDRLKYCPECGFDFTAGQKRCPKCRQQVSIDSNICPQCGLDFEKFSFLIPRLVVFGVLALILVIVLIFPFYWKSSPWMHKKGIITDGLLRSERIGQGMVPLFIHWKTGERYIEECKEASGGDSSTDYMNSLIPLPPEVKFHYDMPIGERVWIIEKESGELSDWVRIGRWGRVADKYGWVHSTNIQEVE